jgi:hypothetical protein
MNNRTLAFLCLAGGAVALALVAVVAFKGFDAWGYPFIITLLAIEFFLAFLFEYLDRRATKRRPLQEVLPPERQTFRRLERHR